MPAYFERQQEKAAHPPYPAAPPRFDAPEPRRFRAWFWFAIVAAISILAGGAWSVQSRLNGHESVIAQLRRSPEALEPVRRQLASTEQRMRDEAVLIGDRERDFEKRVSARVERAHAAARDLGASLRNRMDSEVQSVRKEAAGLASARDRELEERFREIEMRRQAETSRTRQLEQEVARLEARVATQDGELDRIRSSVAREPAEIRGEIRRQSDRINEMGNFNNRERTRFEVSRGSSREIAPGVMLHISRIEPRYRRFNGWLQLVNDGGRFLWLRDQGMLQSIAFHTGKNALRHDLVITDLAPGGATGYLIFPPRRELQGVEPSGGN